MNCEQTEDPGWVLSPAELAATRTKLEQLNRRAGKRGLTGTIELQAEPTTWTVTTAGGTQVEHAGYRVWITGEEPCYGGWRFLAAVDSLRIEDGADGFVLRCAPGVDDEGIDRGQLRAGRCEHCGTQRVNRVHTFLVQHVDTGELKQVGSTCLKDFLGWDTRPVFYSVDDLEDKIDNWRGGHHDPAWTVLQVLEFAEAVVTLEGRYVPTRNYGRGMSTRDAVELLLGGLFKDKAAREFAAAVEPLREAARQTATTMRDELLEHLTEAHGYAANLRTVLQAEQVTPRELGLLVSATAAYRRLHADQERETQRQQERDAIPDAWIAAVGEKVTVTGTLTTAMTVDGYAYNSTQRLLVLRTEAGVVKMITAAGWAYDVDQGETITVAGTVKAHDTYRDLKQTILKRPARQDEPE